MHRNEVTDSSTSTVSKSFQKIYKFGTWNVQGLKKKKKETFLEINKEDPDIVVLTETKLKGKGKKEYNNYIHIYSGVNKEDYGRAGVSILIKKELSDNSSVEWKPINERIITAELNIHGQTVTIIGVYWVDNNKPTSVKNDFAGDFMNVLKKALEEDHPLIILGDFNGKVGTSTSEKYQKLMKKYQTNFDEVIGSFGDEEVTDNGETLLVLCKYFGLKIQNTFFDNENSHRYTWYHKTKASKSIIDYCITRHKTKLMVHDVVVCKDLDCGSDHKFLKSNISLESDKNVSLDKKIIEKLRQGVTFSQKCLGDEKNDVFDKKFNEIFENIAALSQERLIDENNDLCTDFKDTTESSQDYFKTEKDNSDNKFNRIFENVLAVCHDHPKDVKCDRSDENFNDTFENDAALPQERLVNEKNDELDTNFNDIFENVAALTQEPFRNETNDDLDTNFNDTFENVAALTQEPFRNETNDDVDTNFNDIFENVAAVTQEPFRNETNDELDTNFNDIFENIAALTQERLIDENNYGLETNFNEIFENVLALCQKT